MSENASAQSSNGLNYIIDPDLKSAVEVALDLGMPLLVTGEPGTGKTKLARYVAEEMLGTDLLEFNTKTTSKAKDLLYRYDALSHFRDTQIEKVKRNPMEYVEFAAMGKGIIESPSKRYVVLVDEIDKAPRDFPNDVLFEFDEMAFKVEEASMQNLTDWHSKHAEYKELEIDKQGFFRTSTEAAKRPVLILTSNSEKNLPDAFLRRCVYYHISFPQPEKLKEIVQANVDTSESFTAHMLGAAVKHFYQIRSHKLKKLPATAELLSWIKVLKKANIDITKALDGEDDLFTHLKRANVILFKNKEDLEWADKNLQKLITDTISSLKAES
ncbi:MAG: MoxR family ATPase [Bacteroidota bacterium]